MRERLAVVVREGLKGSHLLFDPEDLIAAGGVEMAVDAPVAQEVARAAVALARADTLDAARRRIAACSPECRAQLASLYLKLLSRCAAAQGHVA